MIIFIPFTRNGKDYVVSVNKNEGNIHKTWPMNIKV